MLVQGTLTKISILRLRPVLAAHVKALKTLKKKKKKIGERVGFFSYSTRPFPSQLCNFLQTTENSNFFQTNIEAACYRNKY